MAEIHSFCTLCRSQCGTLNVVENGRLIAVRPDPSHPTGQAVCLKGKAGPEIVAANNRILHPMRRTRPKTDPDPGWQRISWDEALDICAERLTAIRTRYGPEGVAFGVTTKSGTGIADSVEWVDRLVRVFGSPNIAGAVEVCNWHKDVAHRFTFGVAMPVADYANADLILLWGNNPTSTWLAQADAIARGRAKGAALMVVDPRATPLAQKADVWLQIRPGTDAALAMGIANLLIQDGHIDREFVRDWTNAPLLVRETDGRFLRAQDIDPSAGDAFVAWNARSGVPHIYDTTRPLDPTVAANLALAGRHQVRNSDGDTIACRPAFDLFSAACREWTPERVERVTGVPEDKLKAAAALMAAHSRIAYHAWNGIAQSTNATQSERAIATLYALRGSFDDIGCNRILAKQPINKVDSLSLMSKAQLAKALGAAERPIGPPAEGRVKAVDVYRAFATGQPYPIKGFVAFGTNHLLTHGDTETIRRGLESTEFHVHCDIVETPTARYADIVLPVATPWERESLRVGFEISEAAENLIQLRPASVAPRGEARSDLDIVFALAKRLGFGDQFFDGDVEAGWNHILAPLGITTADLRQRGGRIVRPLKHDTRKYRKTKEDGTVAGFPTETRRVELYSELLLRHGQSPLPTYKDKEIDRVAYPFMLTSVKNGYYCHSQHRGVASLRRRSSVPAIFLNAKAARVNAICNNQWVEVTSHYGQACFMARIDDTLADDTIVAEFGWWESCEPLGKPAFAVEGKRTSNFNVLVSADERDPISGSVAHKAVPCRIAPLHGSDAAPWSGFRRAVVTELQRESDTALSVTVALPDSGLLPDYEPGQYLRVRLRGGESGETLTRAYSLTDPTSGKDRVAYRFCVGLARNRHTRGRASLSDHIHRALKVGDAVEIEAPGGLFTLPRRSTVPVVLIANGIGITPFISYLTSLEADETTPSVTLLYGARNHSEHAFSDRVKLLRKSVPRLSVTTFYSDPRPSDIQGRDYDRRGRLDVGTIDDELIAQGARFYLCGSDAMIEDVEEALSRRGVAKFDIFTEAFVSPVIGHNESLQPRRIVLERSRHEFIWRPQDGSLLECAERLGLKLPSGCGAGQCESCVVRVVSGQVLQQAGPKLDEPGFVMTCQSVPLSDLILDA